ncbi:transcription factor adf-1 [Plakobranchus ocellatus]|uniref:Transcription factor adf-1 n=1 Tax=Plakobranchus ocellatus TaxID=259542 RepID=A0AAV4BSM3_9GAST|nr:transcription factor adf-1 [Plakobranchus ocellatus]
MEEERLIDLVSKYTYLFDKSDSKHSNKYYVSQAWNEIATELNTSAEEAKRKWTNLRDYYRRQIKVDRGSDSTSKGRKKWIYFDQMQFLNPFMTPSIKKHPRPSSPGSDSFNDSDDDGAIVLPNVQLLSASPSPSDDQPASASYRASSPPRWTASTSVSSRSAHKRRAEEGNAPSEAIKVLRESKTAYDDDEHFFRSCLPMVRQLSMEQKLEFRINVQQLLLQAVRQREHTATVCNGAEDVK